MRGTPVVLAGTVAAAIGFAAEKMTIGSGSPWVLPIVLAVIASVGAGGAAMARVWLVERPSGRQSELNDLRAHVRQLSTDYEAVRQRLDDERDERYAERRAAADELAACRRQLWELERQLAETIGTLRELRGGT